MQTIYVTGSPRLHKLLEARQLGVNDREYHLVAISPVAVLAPQFRARGMEAPVVLGFDRNQWALGRWMPVLVLALRRCRPIVLIQGRSGARWQLLELKVLQRLSAALFVESAKEKREIANLGKGGVATHVLGGGKARLTFPSIDLAWSCNR